MSDVINFPSKDEREWILMADMLREDYKNMPDGPATLDECMPTIREHWNEIFAPFSLQLTYNIPGILTEEQSAAIRNAVENGCEMVKERLNKERTRHFALLVGCEYQAAYFRRHGGPA